MNSVEMKLNAILFRKDCPSKMELGEYALDLVDPPRWHEIAVHEAKCVHCQADLVQIRQFMDMPMAGELAVPATATQGNSIIERIKVVVYDLLAPPEFGSPMPSWQPAFRGEEDIYTRVVHAEPYVIALSMMKDLSSWQKQKLIGDISRDTEAQENFVNWKAYLWQEGKLLATSHVDRDSHFYFDNIEFKAQPHELILSGPKVEILLQNLQMA